MSILVRRSIRNQFEEMHLKSLNLEHELNCLRETVKWEKSEAETWRKRYEAEEARADHWVARKNEVEGRLEALEERYHELAMAKCPEKLKGRIKELEKELEIEKGRGNRAELIKNTYQAAVKDMKGSE